QIRRALEPMTSIRALRFDLAARTLGVDAPRSDWPDITRAIRAAGFHAEAAVASPDHSQVKRSQRLEGVRILLALAAASLAEYISFVAPDRPGLETMGMLVAAAAVAMSGFAVLRKGVAALLVGRLDISVLMSVAVLGAFAIGQWPEAAMVMALYSLAELIEARAAQGARQAIQRLLELAPAQAEVLQADGTWVGMPAQQVCVGSRVRVKPGERFPLDGVVTNGCSTADQSAVTGESMPVDKEAGDEVFAGTINQTGALEYDTTAEADDTVLARVIHAVEAAQHKRAPTQRFVDRFAAVYTPGVLVIALAIAAGAPWLLGWPLHTSLYRALVMLVIACPCALVLSTPVTIVSGLTAAARRGIVIKGGAFLERARELQVIALDKTGTLTEGKPRLVATVMLSPNHSEREVLSHARSLALRSDHPLSQAVAAGLDAEPLAVERFGAVHGRGVHGAVAGTDYTLGSHRWVEERGQCSTRLEALLDEHERNGRSLVVFADANGPLALFAVADTTRSTARDSVAELHALGLRTVMLTGDNQTTARFIAAETGVGDVCANLLPEDKLLALEHLRQGTTPVAMVGDGINDAPALAAADVGFAMGGAGAHVAVDAADVVVMNDQLGRVAETIRLSRRTHAMLWQNIAIALGIKAVFFAMALAGSATMWMAVFADMGASLLVVGNGLRLARASSSIA
ncbi:heavy metal translocating P-type ATPase, partial [Ideonella sp.]|uniref:heavy metal translocating P-type ATPase n=1 Tax=Ideonella sp. TaxID=1929293 RepID=UPI002B4931FA